MKRNSWLSFTVILLGTLVLTGCASRGLTTSEVDNLKQEFDSGIRYDKVRIINKDASGEKEFTAEVKRLSSGSEKLLTSVIKRPFVINHKVYYPDGLYLDDFSSDGDFVDWGDFVHELCHVFSYEMGLTSDKHKGAAYNWRYGLKEQLTIAQDELYRIPGPSVLPVDAQLNDFYFEQQCEFFRAYAMYKNDPIFDSYRILLEEGVKSVGGSARTLDTFVNASQQQQNILLKGGWSLPPGQSETTLVARTRTGGEPIKTPQLFRVWSTSLDARDVPFRFKVDGRTTIHPHWEGGSIFLEGKEITILRGQGGEIFRGEWQIEASPKVSAISSTAFVFPAKNPVTNVALFNEPKQFVAEIGVGSRHSCSKNVKVGLNVDGSAVLDSKNKPMLFAPGSSVIGLGKSIVASVVAPGCPADYTVNISIKIAKP